MNASDAYHAHLAHCARCFRYPFSLCEEGDRLLRCVARGLAAEDEEPHPATDPANLIPAILEAQAGLGR